MAITRIAYIALRAVSAVNRKLKRRFTLPGMLVLGAAWTGAVLGVDTERSMSYQMFTLLLAAIVLAVPFAVLFRPRIVVTRDAPRLATAGVPYSYRITVRNQSPDAQRGLILSDNLADPRPSYAQFSAAVAAQWKLLKRPTLFEIWLKLVAINGAAALGERAITEIAAGRTLEMQSGFTPQRRGVLRFETLTVARPDPLNLFNACADYHAPGTLLVLPKCYRVPPLALPGARRYQHGGVALASAIGDSAEFVSLRDYRPGDPLQHVHWKSFARLGYPVVKEYQDEFFERHVLVLDTFGAAASDDVFEEAVAVAASFAATVDTRECLLDLMFVARESYCFTAGRGQLQAQQLLEVLAAVKPQAGEFSTLADSVLGSRAALTSAILVLLAWDEPRRDLVRRLQATGLQVVALVVTDAPEEIGARAPWLTLLQPGKIELGLAAVGA
ncbi:MAG: DUF58 domain-containing protein [Betaproteobacteria bacterium]|nr:DUF58 domain-containing protein [Betaproteobacteria bacterium]